MIDREGGLPSLKLSLFSNKTVRAHYHEKVDKADVSSTKQSIIDFAKAVIKYYHKCVDGFLSQDRSLGMIP